MAKKTKGHYKQLIKNKPEHGNKSEEFNPDYSDVIKDLKRIGILAGTFFTTLVILSFIIK